MWRRIPWGSRRRLKAGLEAALLGDRQLEISLSILRGERVAGLREDLELCLLVLQHSELGGYSCLQIENPLLIGGRADCGYQTLQSRESAARIGERLLCQGLPQGGRLPGS